MHGHIFSLTTTQIIESKCLSIIVPNIHSHIAKRILLFFLSKNSKENGWQIIGAAGRDAKDASGANNYQSLSSLNTAESLINVNQPRILVLGNEGTGLRRNVQAACDSLLGIDRLQQDDRPGSVDSLNVGVATGILISHLKNKIDV